MISGLFAVATSFEDRRCGSQAQASRQHKKIVVDFLYLDLNVCVRCQGAERNLLEAVDKVSAVLGVSGFEVVVNKIRVASRELAIKYRFRTSPTIRVNGKDIQQEARESPCRQCGDLCGTDVDCRAWVYEGAEYTEPPEALIINAILGEVYGGRTARPADEEEYELPRNLEAFFDGSGATER